MVLILSIFPLHQIIQRFIAVHARFLVIHVLITLLHAKVVHKDIFIFLTSTNVQLTAPRLTMKYQILHAFFVIQVAINAVLQAIIVHLAQLECIYYRAAICVCQNVRIIIMEMIKVKFARLVHILAIYAIIHIFVFHANQVYYT